MTNRYITSHYLAVRTFLNINVIKMNELTAQMHRTGLRHTQGRGTETSSWNNNPRGPLYGDHLPNRDDELVSRIKQLRHTLHSLSSSIEKERQLVDSEVHFHNSRGSFLVSTKDDVFHPTCRYLKCSYIHE